MEPTSAAKDNTFLHVLYLTDASVASMPPVSLIDVQDMYGAQVGDRVVLFSKTEVLVDVITYSVEGSSGAVSHLLTGLVPGSYTVTQNGSPIAESPVTTSNQTPSPSNRQGEVALWFLKALCPSQTAPLQPTPVPTRRLRRARTRVSTGRGARP